MLSLSTAYHIHTVTTWDALLEKTRALGYDALELNVQMPAAWMPQAVSSVESSSITISSLHNYCPKIDPVPPGRTIYSGYNMASADPDERAESTRLTIETIEWAARLNAPVVVVHAGEIPTEPTGRELFQYLHNFGYNASLRQKYLDSLRCDREKNAPQYLDYLKTVLDPVMEIAAARNVSIALENRFFMNEMPDTNETLALIAHYAGAPVGYWHDTGHAELFAQTGWVSSVDDMVKPLKDHLLGFHLHDVHKHIDHYAPGCGELDFEHIASYVTPKTIHVVEAHSKSTDEDVRQAVTYLTRHGID